MILAVVLAGSLLPAAGAGSAEALSTTPNPAVRGRALEVVVEVPEPAGNGSLVVCPHTANREPLACFLPLSMEQAGNGSRLRGEVGVDLAGRFPAGGYLGVNVSAPSSAGGRAYFPGNGSAYAFVPVVAAENEAARVGFPVGLGMGIVGVVGAALAVSRRR